MRLVLASTSPRRREILALLRVPFEVVPPEFDEEVSLHLPVKDEVLEFAFNKAQSVAKKNPRTVVIGSDTMIELGGEKIGKPFGRGDAARILRLLSGKTHWIYTSVAIIDDCGGPGMTAVEKVCVEMRPYTENEIDAYLDCKESYDKAGAYSIQGQGSRLIKAIRGDYLAAVGMPLRPIADYLNGRERSPFVDVEKVYSEKSFRNWRLFS